MRALRESLRELGAQHVHWGARPEDYVAAREALIAAVRALAPAWNDTLEQHWRTAITAIIVPMLEGAAVDAAVWAERLAARGARDRGMNQDTHVASVLIVDDTIDTLRLLSDLLSEHGYDVRAVTNGRQALEAVERDPPDLILLDIGLPELDGYEVCRRLRASERSRDVPVIFITALSETGDKVRAFETGGVDYVTKPFQVEEVLSRVKAHVALRRAQAELADSYTRLRALEHLRDDMVHRVIHDMRSPLAALLMDLRFLKGLDGALSEDGRAALQSALEGGPGDDGHGERCARREPARGVQHADRAGGVGPDADGPRRVRRAGKP